MKKHIIIFCTLMAGWQLSAQDTLSGWSLEGATGDQLISISTQTGSNIEAGGILTRGAGIIAVTGADMMISRGWTSNTSPAPDDYYEFSITISPNATATITNVVVALDRNSNGPTSAVLRSSVDGFTGNLGSRSVPLTPALRNYAISLPDVSGTITFRLYGHSASNNTGRMSIGSLSGPDLLIGGTVTLPLRWTGFTGSKRDNGVELQWTTAQESGVSHFVIERSLNGREFAPIGTEHAKNQSSATYRFSDESAAALASDICYYRISEVDWNEAVYYSQIISIRLKEQADIAIYPNPAADYIDVLGTSEEKGYRILDLQGRVCQEGFINAGRSASARLSIGELIPGAYILQMQDGSGPIRFVKE